jgi:hypothetical protein
MLSSLSFFFCVHFFNQLYVRASAEEACAIEVVDEQRLKGAFKSLVNMTWIDLGGESFSPQLMEKDRRTLNSCNYSFSSPHLFQQTNVRLVTFVFHIMPRQQHSDTWVSLTH